MMTTPRLAHLLAGRRPDRTPVVPFIGAAAARLAGASTEEAFLDPSRQAAALAAAYDLARADAVFPFMDLTAEPEALGAGVHWREGVGPEISTPLTVAELALALREASLDEARLPVFRETIRLLSQHLGEHTAIGAYVPGPWTLVASALGLAQASRLVRRDPAQADDLIARAAVYATALAGRYAAAGATLLMILEPCIAGGILGPADCARAVLPRIDEMAAATRAFGVPAVLHVCGDATQILPLLVSVTCAGLSLDAPVDLADAARLAPPELSLWGNLAPVDTLLLGDTHAVTSACHGCLGRMPPGAPHVLASGCEVPVETPPGNIVTMCQSVGRTGDDHPLTGH